ncbi:MAG: pseudouridine synthase [Bacteroidales bacterium]|nr:pseudouridine synthase [Bacteroidales bacterium]
MSYEKKSYRDDDGRSGEANHRDGDSRGRRSLSSKLARDGENRRKARREFFTGRPDGGFRYREKGRYRREDDFRPAYRERRRFEDEGETGADETQRAEGGENGTYEARRRNSGGPRRDYGERRREGRREYGEEGRSREGGRRPYASDRPFRRERGGFGERREGGYGERRERRPRYIEDSPIIDEIVHKRRDEGREAERRPKVLSLEWNEERGLIRLNKYIANAGVCSRREADNLIESGAVTVNGVVVKELGAKVMPTDVVCYGDKVLQREKPVYILLNKPKDFITTTNDEFDRKNVMNLVAGACEQRVYPVGRLDRNTTGLLLITNDGELTKKLTHPRYGVKKIYHVELDKALSQEDFGQIISGLELEDGFIAPDELAYVGDSQREVGITLHSGKNRIVRRIFEHLGYEVVRLDRVYYAGLTKKDLPRGHWRFLRQEEVNILKMSL